MSRLEDISREHGLFFTGPELMSTEFPAPRWAVPGLVIEGLTILAGAPKQGKSWLAVALCADIAAGVPVLGGVPVKPGPAVYFALEDSPGRLQRRLRQVAPEGLAHEFKAFFTLPPMPEATELLDEYLTEHPETRLVVIDVITKIRPRTTPGADRYEIDYQIFGALQTLAMRHRVPIIAVTHTRKLADDDVFATVLGSQGTTGAVDTIIVLKRPRNESDAVLSITGRDVSEAEYALTFDQDRGRWFLAGESLEAAAEAYRAAKATEGLGERSAELIAYVAEHPEGVRAADVAAALDMPDARRYLARLADAGRIARPERGLYAPITPMSHVSHCPNVPPSEWDNGTVGTVSLEETAPLTCRVCGGRMLADPDGLGTHPGCDPLAVGA